MGTKLNKKNEKRKNIHRIIAGTLYKNKKYPLPTLSPPQPTVTDRREVKGGE